MLYYKDRANVSRGAHILKGANASRDLLTLSQIASERLAISRNSPASVFFSLQKMSSSVSAPLRRVCAAEIRRVVALLNSAIEQNLAR